MEDRLYRQMLNVIAGGAFTVTLALQPGIAGAATDELPAAPSTTTATPITAPFDPICPLCFIREFLESGSGR